LIDENIEFREVVQEGEPTFLWRDLDGDEDDLFQFVANNADKKTAHNFLMAVLKAMYERKYRKSSDGVREVELRKLLWQ
jgi:hypothetical protein